MRDSAIATIAESDPGFAAYVHASTHLTISANQGRAGTKSNIIADRAKTELDIRSMPGDDRESIEAHLRQAMGPYADAVEIEARSNNPSSISSVPRSSIS